MNLIPYPKKILTNDVFQECTKCVKTSNEKNKQTNIGILSRFILSNCIKNREAIENKLSQISDSLSNVSQSFVYEPNCESNYPYAVLLNENTDANSISICEKMETMREAFSQNDIGFEKEQGYVLSIEEECICIVGKDDSGLFYGLTTLNQLLYANSAEADGLGSVSFISDWPSIQIRGHFDDVSRKRISTVEDFKLIVRELGEYKTNYYGIYIEDVLHLKSFPDIGHKRGKMMPSDVQEIISEGKKNNVEIIPFFQVLGHYENVLAMPNYSYLGRRVIQQMSTLDPDNPEVQRMLRRCIADVCEMFPGEYFGMGCDETQGLDADTYIRHLNWCAEELLKHGKRALFWADMFYNHFGVERMKDLHPALIPVNWQYGTEDDGTVKYQDYLEQSEKNIWGFGGYNSWCLYVPDFSQVKTHMDIWSSNMACRAQKRNEDDKTALLYSQWGDNGYENNRDLIWPLIAYASETSWRGGNTGGADASFDKRFQEVFLGLELPALKRYFTTFGDEVEVESSFYWNVHRKKANNIIRMAANNPDKKSIYEHDFESFSKMYDELTNEQALVFDQMSEHGKKLYYHVITSMALATLNAKKLLLGYDLQNYVIGSRVASEKDDVVNEFARQVDEVREIYITDWLLNNRREGLSVSQDVFDEVAASFEELIGRDEYRPLGYVELDFNDKMNICFDGVSGVPIEHGMVEGVPYTFADRWHTHLRMEKKGEKLEIALATLSDTMNSILNGEGGVKDKAPEVADLYAIISSPLPPDMQEKAVVRVKIESEDGTVKSEDLHLVKELCDWWAPAGDHIWAGGGYAYTDKERVSLAMNTDLYYGLCCVKGFTEFEGLKNPRKVIFELLEDYEVNLFAATLKLK